MHQKTKEITTGNDVITIAMMSAQASKENIYKSKSMGRLNRARLGRELCMPSLITSQTTHKLRGRRYISQRKIIIVLDAGKVKYHLNRNITFGGSMQIV